jgi:hypothetical protein
MKKVRSPLAKRLFWFVLLWMLGVGVTGLVALIIKIWLRA